MTNSRNRTKKSRNTRRIRSNSSWKRRKSL